MWKKIINFFQVLIINKLQIEIIENFHFSFHSFLNTEKFEMIKTIKMVINIIYLNDRVDQKVRIGRMINHV